MMRFKEFLLEEQMKNETSDRLQVLLYMMENVDTINESTDEQILENVNKHVNKIGLKLHKSKSLIDYIKSFTTGAGKLFLYMIKGDTKKAKELLKSIKKEDVLDFIIKLDLGTLHIITGPLHTIDAWTGWDLAANVQAKMEKGSDLLNDIKHGIDEIRAKIVALYSDEPTRIKQLDKNLQDIEATIS